MPPSLDDLLADAFARGYGVSLLYNPTTTAYECVLSGVLLSRSEISFYRPGDTPTAALISALDHAAHLESQPTLTTPAPTNILERLGLKPPAAPASTPIRRF